MTTACNTNLHLTLIFSVPHCRESGFSVLPSALFELVTYARCLPSTIASSGLQHCIASLTIILHHSHHFASTTCLLRSTSSKWAPSPPLSPYSIIQWLVCMCCNGTNTGESFKIFRSPVVFENPKYAFMKWSIDLQILQWDSMQDRDLENIRSFFF